MMSSCIKRIEQRFVVPRCKQAFPCGLSYGVDNLKGLESADQEDFQTFSLGFVPTDFVVERVVIEMLGTVDGEDSFMLLDGRVHGSIADNPRNVYQVTLVRRDLVM